jgi:hypothetical protein
MQQPLRESDCCAERVERLAISQRLCASASDEPAAAAVRLASLQDQFGHLQPVSRHYCAGVHDEETGGIVVENERHLPTKRIKCDDSLRIWPS